MIRNIFITIISITLFSCNTSSQNGYKVVSIDSLPSIKYYLIKVKEGEKQLTIISAYNSAKLSSENYAEIKQGTQLNIILQEVSEKENPFTPLIESNRKGKSAIYVDGELFYDPKDSLYYSACIKGLQHLVSCK